MTPKALYAYRTDRLLSRIRNALISWRFGRQFDCPTFVVWPPTADNYASYDGKDFFSSRIFDLPRLALDSSKTRLSIVDGEVPHEVSSNWLERWDSVVKSKGEIRQISDIFDTCGNGYFGGHQWLRMTGESTRIVHQEVAELFWKLPIAPKMLSLANEILTSIDITNSVGVHIRRGDLIDTLRLAAATFDGRSSNGLERATKFITSKTVPLSTYKSIFNHRNIKRKSLVVFSDDENIGNSLLQEVGRRGIVIKRDNRLSPIESDFLAFFILAKCKIIVGGGSTFSGFASLVGGGSFVNLRRFSKKSDFVDMIRSEVFPDCYDVIDTQVRKIIDNTVSQCFLADSVAENL